MSKVLHHVSKNDCTECGVQSPFSNWFAIAVADHTPETPTLNRKSKLISPSAIPVVLGIISSLGALVLLLIALLFFKLSSDQAALKSQSTRKSIDLAIEGIPVPANRH